MQEKDANVPALTPCTLLGGQEVVFEVSSA